MTKRVDELELQIGEDDERLNWNDSLVNFNKQPMGN